MKTTEFKVTVVLDGFLDHKEDLTEQQLEELLTEGTVIYFRDDIDPIHDSSIQIESVEYVHKETTEW